MREGFIKVVIFPTTDWLIKFYDIVIIKVRKNKNLTTEFRKGKEIVYGKEGISTYRKN